MNPLENKTIFFLGSSVTFGSGAQGESFVEFLAQRNHLTPIKEAVSGTTLVDLDDTSYIARMKAREIHQKPDLFLCQLSTNDATRGLPLGNISESKDPNAFDTTTIAGAIEYIIAWAQAAFGCPVAFYTNPIYESPNYARMVKLLLELQKKWGFAVIDLWNDPAFANLPIDLYSRYMRDPIHPTREGYLEWWVPKFEEELSSILG